MNQAIKQFLHEVHNWLIRKIVGQKPVILNVECTESGLVTGEAGLVCRCVFDKAWLERCDALCVSLGGVLFPRCDEAG